MTFKKLPPVPADKIHQGCLSCPSVLPVASMDTYIAVGFGSAQVTKDGKLMFDGESGTVITELGPSEVAVTDDMYLLQYWEDRAKEDPDHDWRISLVAPLRDREYQRQGDGEWALVKSGMGFA